MHSGTNDQNSDGGRLSAEAVYADLDEARAKDAYALLNEGWTRSAHEPELKRTGEKPWLIGVITTIPDLPCSSHPFFGPVQAGIRTATYRAHCDVLVPAHGPALPDGPDLLVFERCREHGVQGLIVMGIGSGHVDYCLALESGLPVVFVDFDAIGEHVGYVMSNNVEAAASAVSHLHKLGRRRIATITDGSRTRPGIDRLLGYRSGLARLGLEAREEYIAAGDFYHRSGLERMQQLLALPEPPDAVVAASDMNAVGVILAIERAGLRVPEDIAVVGFDDAPFASQLRPALTSVRLKPFELGFAAAEGVIAMLDDPSLPPPAIRMATELAVRESCGIEIPRSAPGW